MKLELKHLAAYLPYALNVVIYSDNEPKKDYISGIYHNPDEMVVFGEGEDYYLSNPDYNIISFKPILRPLSDLNKDIEIGGKIFNPFEAMYYGLIPEVSKKQELEDLQKRTMLMPYFSIIKLIEWHFDIFGLIDKGLAVDINSL